MHTLLHFAQFHARQCLCVGRANGRVLPGWSAESFSRKGFTWLECPFKPNFRWAQLKRLVQPTWIRLCQFWPQWSKSTWPFTRGNQRCRQPLPLTSRHGTPNCWTNRKSMTKWPPWWRSNRPTVPSTWPSRTCSSLCMFVFSLKL